MAVFDNIKGIGVASGFKLQAQSALDPRLVVATIAERDELVTGNGAYEGMSVYVKANKKTYQLQGTTTSDWVDITSEASSTSAIEKEISDAKGSKASLKDRIDDVEATANSKVASVSVGDGITKTGTDTDPVLDVKVDPASDNALTKSATGLKVVVPEGKDYTVTVDTTNTTSGAAKSYTLKQLGKNIATIDIPKDMVVSEGVVKKINTKPDDFPEGQQFTAGTYIVLTIANKASNKLYINVSDLLDDKTVEGVAGTDITVIANSSEGPVKITATINEKSVQTKHIADSAVITGKINNKAVTTAKIADGAVDTLQIKDNAVTTDKVLDSAITTGKINDSAITTTKISDGAVTIDKIATEAKTTTIVKDAASDTTVPTTKAVTDYVDTAITDGSVQTVVVSGGTNNGTVKLTVDGVATDNITVTGWDTKADEVKVERIKYYGDPDVIPSDEGYFTVNESGETITGLTEAGKTQTELVIPYKINGKEITTLYSGVVSGASILKGNSIITKVIIPNSVTSIGEYAFYDCRSLVSINIPHSVTSIGDGAFSDCRLTSIEIPNSVTSISADVFNNCYSLKSINIPNSVVSVGNYVFSTCTSLTKIEIPNSVTSIGEGAFDECTSLTIYCEQGSYAETYAKTNNIPVVYTDIKAATLDAKANAADVYTTTQVDSAISDVTTIANKAKATADSKVKVVWVAKGESIPTTAEANSLCFRIL
ncbi:MAG: leucine-rich repeat domain-containing protein [Candidatus Onthovivens sp.]|nr:leucine-rich repeat domain-containing protein [Candidatus Onthovivens sp.]